MKKSVTVLLWSYKNFEAILLHPLFWILVVCFTLRNYFDNLYGYLGYNTDSASYYFAAVRLFEGYFDDYRTPLYPFIIAFVEFLWKDDIFEHVVLIQRFVSFLSILPFYLLVHRWFKNTLLEVSSTITYGCFLPIFKIIYGIFAESLAISLLVLFVYNFDRTIRRPSQMNWILTHLFVFLLVMLKPICIILYPVVILVVVLHHFLHTPHYFNKNSFRHFLYGFAISSMLLLGYCSINKVQNNYWGLSTVSHDNNFANVVLSEAYYDIPDERLISIIDTARYYGHYYTIYYLNNDHDKYQRCLSAFPSKYPLTPNMLGVGRIPSNAFGYYQARLSPMISKAMCTEAYVNYIITDFIAFSWSTIYSIKGFLFYLILFLEFLLIIRGFQKHKAHPIRFLTFLVGAGLLFASIVGGIKDGTRERVMLPLLPFFILMLFDLLNQTWNYFRIWSKRYRKLMRIE